MRERASERERERKKERERQKERERERKRERERERKRERERERRTRAAGGGSKVKTAACRGNRAVEHDWLYHMSVRVSVYFEDYAIHIKFSLIAFITGNSSLEPLIEGLCAQIHVNLR